MYTPDGIMGSTLILCYLSEVVVLKLASAVLYLECRPLDNAHWRAGVGRRQRFAANYGSAARNRRRIRAVGPELPTRVDVYTRTRDM